MLNLSEKLKISLISSKMNDIDIAENIGRQFFIFSRHQLILKCTLNWFEIIKNNIFLSLFYMPSILYKYQIIEHYFFVIEKKIFFVISGVKLLMFQNMQDLQAN